MNGCAFFDRLGIEITSNFFGADLNHAHFSLLLNTSSPTVMQSYFRFVKSKVEHGAESKLELLKGLSYSADTHFQVL